MSFAIETQNLTKHFPKINGYRDLILHPFKREKVTALHNINLKISSGDVFCLLGPNGAGKTTLLKILCGLIIPSDGKALISGFDSTFQKQRIKKEIGFVINEERSFYWRLTGIQNLKFFATLNNMNYQYAKNRIDEVVELTDIKDFINDSFSNYSSGMKQKLAIARALLTKPKIIIMDEPTRSLDPMSVARLKDFVINLLNKDIGKTLLIATHDIKFVEEIYHCSIGILDKGKLLLMDSVANIKSGTYTKSSLEELFSIVIQQKNIQPA